LRLAVVPLLLSATGDINASATITFSEAATLGSLSAVAASTSIDFTDAAALGSLSAIAASASIVFSEVGGLDAFSFGDMVGATPITFMHQAILEDALIPPTPTLPILVPHMRSIDAKTLADHFNRGQIRKPDYEWPNARKFYQDDSPA